MALTTGQVGIRGENVTNAIKGFAEQAYKMKQVCLVQNSSSWTETYYSEDSNVLTGGTGSPITGVPRGANFPYTEPNWTKKQGVHVKYAAEGVIFMEDKLTDAIDVQARTLKRVAQAIAYAVDTAIYTGLSGATGINTAAAVATWDNATVADRDPIRDILVGIQYLAIDNYDALENGYLLLSPEDYTHLLMNSKVINNPSFKTADVVSNGVVGQVCGLKIIVSNTVTADEAMIVVGQRAATWKSAVPLTTAIIEDVGIKFTIRAWEIGQLQVTDPEAIHVITNTQA